MGQILENWQDDDYRPYCMQYLRQVDVDFQYTVLKPETCNQGITRRADGRIERAREVLVIGLTVLDRDIVQSPGFGQRMKS